MRTGRRSRDRAGSRPAAPIATARERSSFPSRIRRTSRRREPSRTTILFTTGRTSTASARTQPRRRSVCPADSAGTSRSPSRPRRDARARTIWNWWSGRNRCIRRTMGAEGAGAEWTATACVSSPAAGNAVGARLGRRPPRQQTRTPSRARPLRRMRGADRPPPHDSFGRAAALRSSLGEGAGGAAPSPPRTGGRPLFRLYPGRCTERPKLARSREDPSIEA